MDRQPEPIGPEVTEVLATRLLSDETLQTYLDMRREYRAELDELRERYWKAFRRHRKRGASPDTYGELDELRDEESARITQEFQQRVRGLIEDAIAKSGPDRTSRTA